MNSLFIGLYLDEDVDVAIAASLKSKGFSATTTLEAGRNGDSDEEQLAYAASRGLALLTHNRVHFEQLARTYISTDRHHSGVILASRRPARAIVKRLLVHLNAVDAEEMRDQVRYI